MAQAIDARVLREAMARYLEALRAHRDEIDSLNVFPVPDGDTGTNMLLTQQAVGEALDRVKAEDLTPVGDAISRAALMGARGNSGVILSQVLRGLCARMCREVAAGPADLAEGLAAAADEARRAVAEPVEGTMLTVLGDAADAARRACRDGADCDGVAQAALAAAVDSLGRTPDRLPVLAEAGVVDAGARGVVLLLDALDSTLRGVPMRVEVGPAGPVGRAEPTKGVESGYGFEVMYLLVAADAAVGPLRRRLGDIGDSLVVVGGGGLYNVHVHTDDAGRAVEVALAAGRPRNIRIASLDEQVAEACLAGQARGVRVAEASGDAPASGRTAVVAVAPGDGVAALFRSLGAVVVQGGAAGAPSVPDVLDGVAAVAGEGVLLLPNHPDARLAAEGAAAEAVLPARVVATSSVAEGLAAATAVVPEQDLETNLRRAAEAARRVRFGEVVAAAGETDTPMGRVPAGSFLGMAGQEIVVAGRDLPPVAAEVARRCRRERHEIATVLAGAGVSDEHAGRVASAIEEALGDVEVEWHRGGQPSALLIGLE